MKKPKKKKKKTRGVIWFENISKTRRVRLSWSQKAKSSYSKNQQDWIVHYPNFDSFTNSSNFWTWFSEKKKKKNPARLLLPSIPVTWGLKSRQI